MDTLTLKAMAKINLGLDVVGKKENGYHEVRMIMQTIRLFDKIRIKRKKEQGITLSCNLKYLPVNENNLAYKAAKLLMDEFQVQEGVDIQIEKHIPVAAGMAGGSTDAAAVLVGVNQMFELGLSKQDLMERGVKLGADVPYCIMRGTALAEGIGEELSELPDMMKCYVLIAKPKISVSTKWVYENLKLDQVEHPDIDALIADLENRDLESLASHMGNVLESVTILAHPVIEEIKDIMKEQGALNAMMSGSGPTVFGLYKDKEVAKEAMKVLRKKRLANRVCLAEIFHNTKR